MAQVESTAGMVDVEHAARGEWLSWTRMSDYAESAPPVIVGGDGPYVIDQDGRRLLDCVSGLFTTQIGYSHGARIGAAAATQLERLGFYPNWAATHPAALALTDRILGLAPAGLTRLFLTSGGSESVESAWKLARQHHLAKGQHARRKVIARRGAYHGCSLGALSLTGIPAARAAFEPLLGDARHVANTDGRNCAICRETGSACVHAADAIEQQILAEGPDSVAMVIVEPVQNAGGCLVPPPGYAKAVREICDRYGVLLCCDEVITGYGRLGEWFGSTRLGFEPDIITTAKGMTSGYAPLGGVLFSDKVAEPFLTAKGVYTHGYTFGGHPLSCAIALENLAIMDELQVLQNVRDTEGYLESTLNDVAAGSPIAVEARGAGFFRALELTSADLLAPARDAIRRHNVIVRLDDRVRPFLAVSPPLISTREHVDELGAALRAGLAEVAAARG
jgi:adenosylmethionine-8-amino-7-oxononanoate aminotransferase